MRLSAVRGRSLQLNLMPWSVNATKAGRRQAHARAHAPGTTSLTSWHSAGCFAALSIQASGEDSGHTHTRPSSTCRSHAMAHVSSYHSRCREFGAKETPRSCIGRKLGHPRVGMYREATEMSFRKCSCTAGFPPLGLHLAVQ